MYEVFYMEFEKVILDFFHSIHGTFFDYIVLFITLLGDTGVIWFATGLIFIIFKKTRAMGIIAILSVIIPTLLNDYIIKPGINRARPFVAFGEYLPFVERIFKFEFLVIGGVPTKASMISGHTISSFAAAGSIVVFSRKFGIPALILASLIGISRVYLLVHFPTDVMLGLVFGLIFGIGFSIIYKKLIEPRILKKKEKRT